MTQHAPASSFGILLNDNAKFVYEYLTKHPYSTKEAIELNFGEVEALDKVLEALYKDGFLRKREDRLKPVFYPRNIFLSEQEEWEEIYERVNMMKEYKGKPISISKCFELILTNKGRRIEEFSEKGIGLERWGFQEVAAGLQEAKLVKKRGAFYDINEELMTKIATWHNKNSKDRYVKTLTAIDNTCNVRIAKESMWEGRVEDITFDIEKPGLKIRVNICINPMLRYLEMLEDKEE